MADPIYTHLLICERVLRETDGVLSAIRMVDVFNVRAAPATAPEQRPVHMAILFTAKFPPDDETEHTVQIQLQRPDGKIEDIRTSGPAVLETQFPDMPKGLNLVVRFGVFPKAMGTHFLITSLDGKEVGRAPFTLQERPEKPDADQ